MRGDVLEQVQGRLIGPVQIIEEQHVGGGVRPSLDERQEVREQVMSLLGRWQLDRCGDVVNALTERRDESRDFRRRLAQRLAKRVGRHTGGALHDLDPGDEWRRALRFIAPSGQGQAPALAGLGQDLLGEPRLPDTRFAAQKEQSALSARDQPVEELAGIGTLGFASDVGGAPTGSHRLGAGGTREARPRAARCGR